jgi:apolipoprotein N-acyltransferase
VRGALLAAASGALLLAAAPPLAVAPLAPIALAPLCLAARRARGLAPAAALGWLTGALFHAGLVPWLPAVIARTQAVAWPAAALLAALFVALHALQFAAVAAVAWAVRHAGAGCLAVAAAWVLLEHGFPQVLPWSLGATLGPHPLLRQGADLVGAHGLAALLVACSALVADATARWSSHRVRAGAALALAGLLLTGASAYGALHARALAAPAVATARVGVAQTGGGAEVRDPQQAAEAAWADHARLSLPLAGRVDLLVWPEDVLRVYLRAAGPWRRRAESLARRLNATLVIGALDRAADGAELNAAYVFAPSLAAVRYKSVLVPFGEYRPAIADWLPPRAWRVPAPRRPGPALRVVDAGLRIAPSICVEAIVPGAFNAAVREGGALLVNVSDDAWFDSAWAAAQHLEMTRLRAVETRRWLVRASSSGISAVIDPNGAIVAALPYGARGTIVRPVASRAGVTPYARWGDAPLVDGAAATLLIGAAGGARRHWRQARSNSRTSASESARS